ncbi:acetyl-CoA carboxylase biotin carboxyl carrier protein subunit [Candidatus Babeliales bacterium]|nr:acetyl-CoA carboxylase biotin carboxyl carrier protein subunit [Candidatus Babeliales bacterium]
MAIKNIKIQSEHQTKNYEVDIKKENQDKFSIKIKNKIFEAKIIDWDNKTNNLVFEIENKLYKSHVTTSENNPNKQTVLLNQNGTKSYEISHCRQKIQNSKKRYASKNLLKSPLAGRIIKTFINPNQYVKKNQELLVIESMKMENEIRSETDAFIKTISIVEGDLVQQNQVLITFEVNKNGERNNDEEGQIQNR